MSIADDLRRRIVQRLQRFEESREPRHEITWGLMGDVDGTVSIANQTGKVYCRLLGITSNLVRAWNAAAPLVADMRVDIEVERQEGMPDDYTVLGASRIAYIGYADHPRNYVSPHHETHEYTPGVGGYDIINVYNRALAELRADSQATPDMTLRISSGSYPTENGIVVRDWANSPAFSAAPGAGLVRYDLLYLDTSDSQYKISEGAAAPAGVASRPMPGSGHIPIAWAFIESGDTAILHTMIIDARILYMTLGSVNDPADIAEAASPGTALIFSPRDHVHAHPVGLGADLHHSEEHVLDPRAADAPHTGTLPGLHAHADNENKAGECNGVKTIFFTAQEFSQEGLHVLLNGQLLTLDDDYTEGAFHDSFIMSVAPIAGDSLMLSYIAEWA